MNGHSIGQYRIHAGKTVPIVKGGEQTKMEVFKFLIGYQYISIVLAILFRKMKFMLLKLLVPLAKDMFMMIWTALII